MLPVVLIETETSWSPRSLKEPLLKLKDNIDKVIHTEHYL